MSSFGTCSNIDSMLHSLQPGDLWSLGNARLPAVVWAVHWEWNGNPARFSAWKLLITAAFCWAMTKQMRGCIKQGPQREKHHESIDYTAKRISYTWVKSSDTNSKTQSRSKEDWDGHKVTQFHRSMDTCQCFASGTCTNTWLSAAHWCFKSAQISNNKWYIGGQHVPGPRGPLDYGILPSLITAHSKVLGCLHLCSHASAQYLSNSSAPGKHALTLCKLFV